MNIFDLDTPEKLYDWMSRNIEYGTPFVDDVNDRAAFCTNYRLQSPAQLLQSRKGVCWDQTELERCWFRYRGIEHRVVYIEVNPKYNERQPTHTALLYEDGGRWAWFENAWQDHRGIRCYNDLEEAARAVIVAFMEANGGSPADRDLLKVTYFGAPPSEITCAAFMEFAFMGTLRC